MSPEFVEFVRLATALFPDDQRGCAAAIGVSPGRLGDALHNRTAYAFNIINCLELARVINVPPSRVLRAAGHTRAVELIEGLYGTSAITPAQARHLAHLSRLPLPRRRLVCRLAQGLAEELTPPTTKKR